MARLPGTLMPFLYPSRSVAACLKPFHCAITSISFLSTQAVEQTPTPPDSTAVPESRLNPTPEDYARTIFADKCRLILQAGSGGHGCVSFLREKFIPAGPANGGDGGSGGNIYIQAVRGETSLHKLANQGVFKATRGRNGQGKSKGGPRGDDVLIQVPVGTVVREVARLDPVAIETESRKMAEEEEGAGVDGGQEGSWRRDKWILSPSVEPSEFADVVFPPLPKPRRAHIAAAQVPSPVLLDLSKPMEEPMLLAAGAVGGLGNPHFVTKEIGRPKYASKGSKGMRLEVELELKLVADLGFVGLPNAGKSTLLRAVTKSRARVGNWEFTTLQPNIGTVVLDDNRGRAKIQAFNADGERRTQFSIADIPGLVPDAHLDRGLGLDFLRHVERARVLAFVVDLSKDPVQTLRTLWKELEEFEKLKEEELNHYSTKRIVSWQSFGSSDGGDPNYGDFVGAGDDPNLLEPTSRKLPPINLPPISSKPWFVVASKADLEGTKDNFLQLQDYLSAVVAGEVEHPTGVKNRWNGPLRAIPISAIRGEGVDQIATHTISLLSS